MKAKINLKNIIAYTQGNLRYKLYYSWFKCLIPKHVLEQIDVRIRSMNQECYNMGSCIKCGCQTTHLQMANKSCEGNCYPVMLSKKQWGYFKKRKLLLVEKTLWKLKHEKFEKVGNELDK